MAPNLRKNAEEDFVWIYGTFKKKEKAFEFHPKLQDHIEDSFQKGQKSCRMHVFGDLWTLEFTRMIKKRENLPDEKIKRVLRAEFNQHGVQGVSGAAYEKKAAFVHTDPTCHICLYKVLIPTKVESCGHTFCFMCLKSNVMAGMECPTCRAHIPPSLFQSPIRNDLDIHMECPEEYIEDVTAMFNTRGEVQAEPLRRSRRSSRIKYYWIYEDKEQNGWFRFDPRNERFIEESFIRKKEKCRLFIAGCWVTIFFEEMLQERTKRGITHRRKIKRVKATDLDKYSVRGIAGIYGYVRAIK
ncbi:unnamed protein product [Caenorhabditis sp. 36 PRJEB53466]|nr:unnamed protein product [Caenorhabditis sp. 36 PRJEB53466]